MLVWGFSQVPSECNEGHWMVWGTGVSYSGDQGDRAI